MYMNIYECMYVCICIYIYHIYIYIYIYIYVTIFLFCFIYSYIYTFIHTCISPHTHICIQIYIYEHIQTPCITGWRRPIECLISCRSFFAREPLIIGLLCGNCHTKIRHPTGLRHPVLDFGQKKSQITGCFLDKHTCIYTNTYRYIHINTRWDFLQKSISTADSLEKAHTRLTQKAAVDSDC